MKRYSIALSAAAILHLGIAITYFMPGQANASPEAIHNHASNEAPVAGDTKDHATCDDKKGCALCAEHKNKKECADKKTCPLNAKTKKGQASNTKHAECPHHNAPKAGV